MSQLPPPTILRLGGLCRTLGAAVVCMAMALTVMVSAPLGAGAQAGSAADAESTSTANDAPQPTGSSPSWLVRPLNQGDDRVYFVYDLEPGEWVEDVVEVVNHSDEDITLRIFGSDAFNDPSTGAFDLLPTAEEPVDVGSWVAVAGEEITVPGRARMQVPFVLAVPADATPGDHVGGIVTSFASVESSDGGQILFDARIAVRIYLHVPGEIQAGLDIAHTRSTFEMSPLGVTGDLTVSYTVTNTGNVRLAADESVAVGGILGIGNRDPLNGAISELLPGEMVQREIVIESVPAAARLHADLVVTPKPVDDRIELGVLVPREARLSSWAIPWFWGAVVIIVVGAVARVIQVRRRRWQHLNAQLAAAQAGSGEQSGTPKEVTSTA